MDKVGAMACVLLKGLGRCERSVRPCSNYRRRDPLQLTKSRVGEKRERAALIASEAKRKAQEPPPNPFLAPAKPSRWRFAGRFAQS
jgi:hypothetical protein